MMDLNFVRLLTEDYEDMFRFYSETLGLDTIRGSLETDYSEFDAGSITLALYKRENFEEDIGFKISSDIEECQDKSVIILKVDNVDEYYKKLKEKNVIFLTEPTERPNWNIKTAHFRDPEGNIIEINHLL